MIRCYGYIRVSTLKQGDKGVSLQEQRAAILQYASRHGIEIIEWFEERLTAAKSGRPTFAKMLKQLRGGKAEGVIIHKIDRSARNLRDWAELGELIDSGVLVKFAHESLDLLSRGGRLTADIQAVIAADYVRNLREETLKGIRGRLKQGLLPFAAPLGYLDTGGGNVKAIDSARAPLVRQAFELYASGRYSLDSLAAELHRRGLVRNNGERLYRSHLSKILNNPFYAGLIRIQRTGECYQGVHVPLIRMELFKQVQARLAGRIRSDGWTHDFTFRGLFKCELCGRFLIGERQKRIYTYYRCHTRGCGTRAIREEVLEGAILRSWPRIAMSDEERQQLAQHLEVVEERADGAAERQAALELQLAALEKRLTRLMDAFLDGDIPKVDYESRKNQLLEDQRVIENALQPDENAGREKALLLELLNLASSAQQSYEMAHSASKRELAIQLCSNFSANGKKVVVEPHPALRVLAKRHAVHESAPHRTATRTLVQDAWKMYRWAQRWLKRQDLKATA